METGPNRDGGAGLEEEALVQAHDAYDYGTLQSVGWWTRLLWYACGADGQLLARCPQSDRVKFQGLGGVVVATAMLAFVSGSYAFYVVFGPKGGTALVEHPVDAQALGLACGFGLLWSLVIFNIDRFIVASTGKGDGTEKITFGELFSALPRIFMAVIIGVALSAPLEIRILETEIDTELASRQKAERQRLDKATDARTERDRAELSAKIDKSRVRLDARTAEYEKRRQEILVQRHALEVEAEGASGSGKPGRGPAWRDKKENLDRLEKELEDWKKQVADQDSPVREDITRWRKQLDGIAAEIQSEKDDNAKAAAKMDGLMMRIHISHEIGGAVPWVIMLLLLSIEVGPIFFKMMLIEGAYDALVENQKRLAAARYGVEPKRIAFVGDKKVVLEPVYHAAETVAESRRQRREHEVALIRAVHEAWRERVQAEIAARPEDFVADPDAFPPAADAPSTAAPSTAAAATESSEPQA
ncbi:MAG: hypothetical protein RIT45_3728 [Pseudomonadota bacterium]